MGCKRSSIVFVVALALLLSTSGVVAQEQGPQSPQGAIGTAFTYQGQLKNASGPVNDQCDFQFSLWDSADNPTGQIDATQAVNNVAVSSGLFTVQLDFGASAFTGDGRWLKIAVRCPTGSGSYTTLSPRQELTAVPYALSLKPGAQIQQFGASVTLAKVTCHFPNCTTTGIDATGGAMGIKGTSTITNGYGVYAEATGTNGMGVYGTAPTTGTVGIATNTSGMTYGVYGATNSPGGYGVYGTSPLVGVRGASSGGVGVHGTSSTSIGVYGNGPSGYGVYGSSSSGTGLYGTASTTGTVGIATNPSGETWGVYGSSNSSSGYGVYGTSPAYGVYGYSHDGYGVRGNSASNVGMYGTSSSGNGVSGSSGSGYGVRGYSSGNVGVHGSAPTTGTMGIATGTSGWTYGVVGNATSSPWGIGVYGNGYHDGVFGNSNVGDAVHGESVSGNGVVGYSDSGEGVYGRSDTADGVIGESSNGIGVHGGSYSSYGVYGYSSTNDGVYGYSLSGEGVRGYSYSGYAGYFNGNVHVTGNLSVTGAKAFKIDNPLNPANEYLYHYAVEAPQVQNMYNGTIALDAKGEAVVTLPDYFSAVNRGEFQYQLTALGAPMPNLYVAEEITGNHFKIAGGVAGKKVSWMVFGQRNDPWVRDHPQSDVVDKPANEAGTYLYPRGYGQPETMSVDYAHTQPMTATSPIMSTLPLTIPQQLP